MKQLSWFSDLPVSVQELVEVRSGFGTDRLQKAAKNFSFRQKAAVTLSVLKISCTFLCSEKIFDKIWISQGKIT